MGRAARLERGQLLLESQIWEAALKGKACAASNTTHGPSSREKRAAVTTARRSQRLSLSAGYYAAPAGGFGFPSGHWMSTFGGKGGSFIAAVFGISPP